MKKGLLVILIALFSLSNVKAQTSVGGGLALWNDTGVELKADFGLSEQISLSPSVDYFFSDLENATLLMFNLDGHYNLGDPDALNYYPLVGINYYYFSWDLPTYNIGDQTFGGNVSDGEIGFTVGAGLTYALSESMKLYGEAKYLHSDFGASVGILFSL